MNNSRNIQTSQSADLITFKVIVEGEALSKKYQVKQVRVDKEVNRISSAVIVLLDGDAAQQDFELSNEDLLIPGKKIEITAGYHSDEDVIFKGIVIKHSLKIRSNSALLSVECKDESVKLTVGRKSNYYYEKTDSDIFETIIERYGLDKEIESTNQIHRELVQYHASDWDFMVSRAQANGKLCFVDDGKITIKRPNLDQDEVETISYGATLLDFDAEIDARNQVRLVTSYGWNPADQELLKMEANDPAVQLNGNLSPSDLASTIGLDNLELRHGGLSSNVALQNWADAKFLFQQLAKVRGRVKFQGIPTVKPGDLLKLEGVGNRFNGKVYVTGIRHQIAEGNWTVDAQFGLEPTWFSETFDLNASPASGMLPGICGLQVGKVTQLQDDPNAEDRILVQVPIINNEEQGIWCRMASLDAGDSRGACFRPEIRDEVVIGFINDDPNDAIVLGMLYSSANPAPILASDDNNEKGFVTRSKIKILFNDDKKSIIIETPGGKRISLDEDAGHILIEDENSNTIKMDSDGISFESGGDIQIKATGDVTIEGNNISAKANLQFKSEGSAGVEMSSTGTAVLKGSLVQIN